ncbi:MAG: creatininase family protein, partial [Gemmatimonadaceae bacterium]
FYHEPGDHAGELETSVMMHIAPELVLPLSDAGDGRARKFKLKGLRNGLAWAPRTWAQVTDDTGSGNPAEANSESGEKHLEAVTDNIASFLTELGSADLENLYE